jgi:putative membrane protein
MPVPFLPTLSTFFIILSAIFVAIGWNLIRKRKIEEHKKMMIAAAVSAVLFFIIYISRTIVVGNTSFGGPDSLKLYYTIFLVFHILLSIIGAIMGVITIRSGLKNNLQKHRKIGPISSIIWFFSAITGVMVFLLLYVFYTGGETTSMFRAIFGL